MMPLKKPYLGQENGVDVGTMLKMLQNPHPLDLAGTSMNIQFPKFFGISLLV